MPSFEIGAGGNLSLAEIEYFGTVDLLDTDNDGLGDEWEQAVIDADPNDAFVSLADINPGDDLDGDNLTNLQEYTVPRTDPLDPDSDDDGLLDDVKTGDGTFDNLATDTGTDPNIPDTDGDGLSDGAETNDGTNDGPTDRGTNPLLVDSDSDTYSDSEEIADETDPNNPGSNRSGAFVLGVGAGAFLGNDLTDPEDDGTNDGQNYNATFFATRGDFAGLPTPFHIFSNTSGGTGNKFCCDPTPFFIGATLDEPHVLTHFTLSSSNDSPGRDPDVYRLQGSSDTTNGSDGSWTDIYVYDNDGGRETSGTGTEHRLFPGNTQFNARDLVLRFEGGGVHFDTPAAYTSFRILMQSASGWVGQGNPGDPATALALGELELFGIPGSTAPFEITESVYNVENDTFRFTWNSQPGKIYSLYYSTDLINWERNIDDSILSGGESTTFPPVEQPAAANPVVDFSKIFFRVEENPPVPAG